MLSIAPVRGSFAAATYFERDNYYVAEGDSPSGWTGTGAAALGLSGAVDKATFERLLRGQITDEVTLGAWRDGTLQHSPGWDLTFSAPKSVSLLAELAGDKRLVAAHDAAVRETLGWVERTVAATRVRAGEDVKTVHTASLVAAVFRHDLSRAQEPQLHSHAVIVNATQSEDSKWRSLDSRHFYAASKEAGVRYQQALAMKAAQLGYDVVPNPNGTFEIAGIPRETIEAFSSRAQQIVASLEARGLDRETASGRLREATTIRTRHGKRVVDRDALREAWSETMNGQAVDLQALVQGARDRAHDASYIQQLEQGEALAARNAVTLAASILAERDAAFPHGELERKAGILAFGKTDEKGIREVIANRALEGELAYRTVMVFDKESHGFTAAPGWTTRDAIAAEQRMLETERQSRGGAEPILDGRGADQVVETAKAASAAKGFGWTEGQIKATTAILTSDNPIVGVQGYAGTAKTNTVLATLAGAARGLGYEVTGMAPTASAAQELGKAIGADGITIARHLIDLQDQAREAKAKERQGARQAAEDTPRKLWIVDEASMVGAKTMQALIEGARREAARLVLVGDVKQLGSVEAGRAFGQLQEHGLQVSVLDEIVRQTNEQMREAVYESIRGDAAAALGRLRSGGGRVVEIGAGARTREDRAKAADERRQAIAELYAKLSPEDRAKTIVLDPSRESRDKLNIAIRQALQERGELRGSSLTTSILVSTGLTDGEKRLAMHYNKGELVRFGRAYKPRNQSPIEKDEYLRVVGVQAEKGLVQLQKADGDFVVWEPARWGAARAEPYKLETREIAKGDVITWTRNDARLGAINSFSERVAAVNTRDRTITLEGRRGDQATIDLKEMKAWHFDHGYVQTAYGAQGRTADRVFAHAEAQRLFVVNQKSFYVTISRAKEEAIVFTNNTGELIQGLQERSGENQAALDRQAIGVSREGAAAAAKGIIKHLMRDAQTDRVEAFRRQLEAERVGQDRVRERQRDHGLEL